jgi:hypothetical protein
MAQKTTGALVFDERTDRYDIRPLTAAPIYPRSRLKK